MNTSRRQCTLCNNVGWYLDYAGGGHVEPLSLELLPCIQPDCKVRGRPIAHLAVNLAAFTRAVERDGLVLAVGR